MSGTAADRQVQRMIAAARPEGRAPVQEQPLTHKLADAGPGQVVKIQAIGPPLCALGRMVQEYRRRSGLQTGSRSIEKQGADLVQVICRGPSGAAQEAQVQR